MRSRGRARTALFLLACAALIAAALAFGATGQRSEPSGGDATQGSPPTAALRPPSVTRRAEARAEHLAAGLRRSARGFLIAFFRYEVGERGPAITAALRVSATPAFADRLLAAPPRAPASGFPPPARLRSLHLGFVSAANRALLSGTASRGRRLEPFSFLFRRRGSAWLASGLGP